MKEKEENKHGTNRHRNNNNYAKKKEAAIFVKRMVRAKTKALKNSKGKRRKRQTQITIGQGFKTIKVKQELLKKTSGEVYNKTKEANEENKEIGKANKKLKRRGGSI